MQVGIAAGINSAKGTTIVVKLNDVASARKSVISPTALFFNVPGHGHVDPSLPLVAELTRRGHQITYFITAGYRAKVEAAGANVHLYATVKDDYFTPLTQDGFHPQIVACELLKTAEEILPELLRTCRQALTSS